jgi:glucokinase
MNIGIDLGGRTTSVGWVEDRAVRVLHDAPTPDDPDDILSDLDDLLDRFPMAQATSIGVAVSGTVDGHTGAVRTLASVPSWTEVPLADRLTALYDVPTAVHNTAHCFAMAEYCFGSGRGASPMVGLVLDDGLDGGLVVDGTLLTGRTAGAGAFGAAPYKDGRYEQYCAGHFLEREYDTTAQAALERADDSDEEAQAMFEDMGTHLGHAVQSVVAAVDPACIVMGGPVRHAHPYFEDAMWEVLESFAAPGALDGLSFQLSQLKRPAVLGAAALGRMEGA